MTDIAETNEGPKGIGGWLVLPAIGFALAPVLYLIVLVRDILPIFEPKLWAAITTPGSTLYHPANGSFVVFETGANTVLVALLCVVNFHFWRRSRRLPAWAICWMLASLAVMGFSTYWSEKIPMLARGGGVLDYGDLVRDFVAAAIWVPYFLMSRRVKNTFVN